MNLGRYEWGLSQKAWHEKRKGEWHKSQARWYARNFKPTFSVMVEHTIKTRSKEMFRLAEKNMILAIKINKMRGFYEH